MLSIRDCYPVSKLRPHLVFYKGSVSQLDACSSFPQLNHNTLDSFFGMIRHVDPHWFHLYGFTLSDQFVCLHDILTIDRIIGRCTKIKKKPRNEYLFTVTGVKKMKFFFVSHEVPFPATSDRRSRASGNGTE